MIEISRDDDGVLEVQMCRPEAKNALTLEMYDELTAAFMRAADDDDVRAVLVRGAEGDFTSGNDLRDFMEDPPTGQDSPVYRFLEVLVGFAKPVVAAVDGWAIGIGTTMLLHCDLVYVSERARFQMPFVNLALVPEAGSSHILPKMIGHQRAAELLLFSQKFDAARAAEFGFVNEIVPPDQLFERARERARAITKLPPEAVRLTKMLLRRESDLEEAMRQEGALFIERLRSPELAEAIQAFFEKRAPEF